MIRRAEKLGFVERSWNVGTQEVDGRKYDGLTFRWEKRYDVLTNRFGETRSRALAE